MIASYDTHGMMAGVCRLWRNEWHRVHSGATSPYVCFHEPRRRANANMLIEHTRIVARLDLRRRVSIVVFPSFASNVRKLMYNHFGVVSFGNSFDDVAHIYLHDDDALSDRSRCRTVTLSVWSKRCESTHRRVPITVEQELLLRDYCAQQRFMASIAECPVVYCTTCAAHVYVTDECDELVLSGTYCTCHGTVLIKNTNKDHRHIKWCHNILGLCHRVEWGSKHVYTATMDWAEAKAHYVARAPRRHPFF